MYGPVLSSRRPFLPEWPGRCRGHRPFMQVNEFTGAQLTMVGDFHGSFLAGERLAGRRPETAPLFGACQITDRQADLTPNTLVGDGCSVKRQRCRQMNAL